MATAPLVRLTIDAPAAHYRPGDQLSGRFMVDGAQPWAVRSAELSVLWYTAGQGEEDMAVHHFERLVDEPTHRLDLRVPRRFATFLPPSPLSYDGQIVKVCWCVRVRLFLPHGQESSAEVPFQLGDVGPIRGSKVENVVPNGEAG
ncbi:MAG: hypothetical protein WD468_06335 [Pirellulales bacterium]